METPGIPNISTVIYMSKKESYVEISKSGDEHILHFFSVKSASSITK
jgi:hypothetical protein